MKAELLELGDRKYYGTEIEVFDDDGNSVGYFEIWLAPTREKDYVASERQGGEEYEICDSHYESALTFRIANRIVEAINGT